MRYVLTVSTACKRKFTPLAANSSALIHLITMRSDVLISYTAEKWPRYFPR